MSPTTTDTRPQDRFELWREAIAGQPVGGRLERARGSPFGAEAEARAVGGLVATRWAASAGWLHRTEAEIARSPASFYLVHVQLAGRFFISAGGDRTALLPGDISCVDTLRAVELGGHEPSTCLAVLMPKAAMDARLARPDAMHGAIVRRDRPLARIAASYLLSAFENATELSPAAAAMVAAHAAELLAEAVGEAVAAQPAAPAARRDALFVQACRAIDLACGHPRLSPERIAGALGVSSRHLQKIFAERGETVMGRVYRTRVGCAAKLLAAPEARHRSVTEIAFACGFNDSAHFSRVFAKHLHMTASEWRRRALG
jgi:AraC-like DNA-binding protein